LTHEAGALFCEREIALMCTLIHPGDTVIEVGANIGTHTLALAGLVGPKGWVYAFEAQRMVFQTLCANVALNSLANVDCEHLAVDQTSGSIFVEEMDFSVENNFGGVALGTSLAQRSVPSVSVDDYFQGRPLEFAKIDVEGMEAACLMGGRKTFRASRTLLYLENDRVQNSPELLDCLFMLGYDVYWHLPRFFNPDNFAGEPTNIHAVNFIDNGGPFYDSIGFAINVLCLPQTLGLNLQGLLKVEDLEEHPLRRGPNRFHP